MLAGDSLGVVCCGCWLRRMDCGFVMEATAAAVALADSLPRMSDFYNTIKEPNA